VDAMEGDPRPRQRAARRAVEDLPGDGRALRVQRGAAREQETDQGARATA